MQEINVKEVLAKQVTQQSRKDADVRLTKNMSIPDMVKAMEPEIKRALPSVLPFFDTF